MCCDSIIYKETEVSKDLLQTMIYLMDIANQKKKHDENFTLTVSELMGLLNSAKEQRFATGNGYLFPEEVFDWEEMTIPCVLSIFKQYGRGNIDIELEYGLLMYFLNTLEE